MISIIGPTASGKTRLAVALADAMNSEVISADSRQVYRGMDLGTGKDLSEYQVEGKCIPFHLIDVCPAGSKYNLFQYQRDFHKAYNDILSRGIDCPVLCGGSGLYVESILKGYHLPDVPENKALREQLLRLSFDELKKLLASYGALHNKTDLDSKQRTIRAIEIADFIQKNKKQETEYPAIDSLIICLNLSREERRQRITKRLKERLEEGMLKEVQSLLSQDGITPDDLIYYGLEYKFLTLHLIGEISYNEMFERLEIAIHQFAKRQMTWFRGMERRGFHLNYIDALAPREEQLAQIEELYQNYRSNNK